MKKIYLIVLLVLLSIFGYAQCNPDITPPVAVCQDISVYLDGAGNATITAGDVDGGSWDNCGPPYLSVTPFSFTCTDIGQKIVVLTADDGINMDTCHATVTVMDTATPTAVCQNITLFLDGTGNATITAADVDGGSLDNCGSPSLSISQTSFTCSNLGPTMVTLTATDGSSNSDTCHATVTVMDTVTPIVVCQNITVFLDGSGNATITAGDVDGGSSDNCGSPSLSASMTSFTCSNIGPNSVGGMPKYYRVPGWFG